MTHPLDESDESDESDEVDSDKLSETSSDSDDDVFALTENVDPPLNPGD